jgi:hypothetical protein
MFQRNDLVHCFVLSALKYQPEVCQPEDVLGRVRLDTNIRYSKDFDFVAFEIWPSRRRNNNGFHCYSVAIRTVLAAACATAFTHCLRFLLFGGAKTSAPPSNRT